MRILKNPVWDMETLLIVGHDGSYEYTGPIWECKGDPVVKQEEVSQSAFNDTLRNIFQQQYGKQSAITDFLTKQMEPVISKGGQGYAPDALAAMRTSAADTLSNQFQGAQRASNATMQRGLPSGVNAQISSSLLSQEAQQQAAAQNQITQQNEALKQANYWSSVNALNGQAANLNPLGYAGSSINGAGAIAGLSNANTNAYKNSFGGSLAIGLGNTLSGGIGGMLFGK